MNNDEIENSVIVNRRPVKENEFIFNFQSPIQNVERLFRYVESISDLVIETIPREELPYGQGLEGYRVHKKDLV